MLYFEKSKISAVLLGWFWVYPILGKSKKWAFSWTFLELAWYF